MCEHLMRCIMLCGQKKCLNKKFKKKKKEKHMCQRTTKPVSIAILEYLNVLPFENFASSSWCDLAVYEHVILFLFTSQRLNLGACRNSE